MGLSVRFASLALSTLAKVQCTVATARSRNRSGDLVPGSFTNLCTAAVEPSSRLSSYEAMDDIVGNPTDDNVMLSSARFISGASIGGYKYTHAECAPNAIRVRWDNYQIQHGAFGALPDTTDADPLTTNGGRSRSSNLALRLTNPNRANFLTLVFLKELVEVPALIRHAGRMLIYARNTRKTRRKPITHQDRRELAAANLALQFGWQPLLSDLFKMTQFQKAVDRRSKEIDRLYSGTGLKRRITLKEHRNTVINTRYFWSTYGVVLAPRVTASIDYKKWAVIHYKPTSRSPLKPSRTDLSLMMSGLTPGKITESVWEALPWSWLIDWFTDFGHIVANSDNSLAVSYKGTVMAMTKGDYSSEPLGVSNATTSVSLTAGKLSTKNMVRHKVIPSVVPTLRLPLIGASQLSILGSLAMLKTRN